MPEMLYEGKFLEMVKEGRWEYCRRKNETQAVMIFACTAENELVLVEEFRPPIGKQSICFPAGLSGDEGPESHEIAARRELLEETGYEAARMEYLFCGPSSPGLSSETLHFFLAPGVRKVAGGGGVDGENIIVHTVPMREAESWLQRKREEGAAVDPRIYSGLYFFSREARKG